MKPLILDGITYEVSPRFTQVHMGIVEEGINNISDGIKASEAAFYLKHVAFDKPIPDKYIQKVEDRYILFFEEDDLIEVYRQVYFTSVQRATEKSLSKETDPEKQKKYQELLSNIMNISENMTTEALRDIPTSSETGQVSDAEIEEWVKKKFLSKAS